MCYKCSNPAGLGLRTTKSSKGIIPMIGKLNSNNIWSELFPLINEWRLNLSFWISQSVFVERNVVYSVSNLWYACVIFKHIRRKSFLTSPNRRINVTEIKTAPHATTRPSRKIGSAWQKHPYPILAGCFGMTIWLNSHWHIFLVVPPWLQHYKLEGCKATNVDFWQQAISSL